MRDTDRVHLADLIAGILSALPRAPAVLRGAYEMATARPTDRVSVGSALEHNARVHPHRTALLYRNRRWTHAELNGQVNQYAAVFREHGIGQGDVVTILLDSRPELLLAVGALAKLGAVAALINTSHRGQVLRHSVSVAGGRQEWFVVGEEMLEAFKELRPPDSVVFHLPDGEGGAAAPATCVDLHRDAMRQPAPDPGVTVRSGDPFAHVLTSGTTGMPKAAILRHARWLACARWFGRVCLGLTPDDVLYVPLPLYHTNGLIVAWGAAAGTGAALAVRRRFSASRFWHDVRRHQATAFIYVGELCRYLLARPEDPGDRHHGLRMMLGNGLRGDVWRSFVRRFGVSRVHEFYGMAEGASVFTNVFNLEDTVGFCPRRFAIVAYDPDTGAPLRDRRGRMRRVAPGEAGLLLSGTGAWVGYSDAEASEERLIRDLFEPGDVWLNTGDILRYQGARHAQFVDRLGDTFRWKGENVSACQVEQELRRLPGVAEAVAYGVALPGVEGRAGMAAILTDHAAHSWREEAAAALLVALPRYAVPVFIRVTPRLETTDTFKLRKTALKRDGIATNDPLYVLLPDAERYRPLTSALRRRILDGSQRL